MKKYYIEKISPRHHYFGGENKTPNFWVETLKEATKFDTYEEAFSILNYLDSLKICNLHVEIKGL